MISSCFMPLSHDPKLSLHHNDFDKRCNIINFIDVYKIIFNIIILNNITYLLMQYLIITQHNNIKLFVLYTYICYKIFYKFNNIEYNILIITNIYILTFKKCLYINI